MPNLLHTFLHTFHHYLYALVCIIRDCNKHRTEHVGIDLDPGNILTRMIAPDPVTYVYPRDVSPLDPYQQRLVHHQHRTDPASGLQRCCDNCGELYATDVSEAILAHCDSHFKNPNYLL